VVLDFLSATNVGRLVLAEEDAGSEVSEWELSGSAGDGKSSIGWRPRSWVSGRDYHCFRPRTLLHGARGRGVGDGHAFLCSFLCSFLSLVRILFSRDRPGRRAKGSLQRAAIARTADKMCAAIV